MPYATPAAGNITADRDTLDWLEVRIRQLAAEYVRTGRLSVKVELDTARLWRAGVIESLWSYR